MKNWLWKLYGIFLTSLIFSNIRDFFFPLSSIRTYYTILIAFDKRYLALLIVNIIGLLVNILAALVVFYYAFGIQSSWKFWRAVFFLRILCDLIGHNFYLQFIKSSFYQSFPYGLACVGVFVLPILPSYIAHYNYIRKLSPKGL